MNWKKFCGTVSGKTNGKAFHFGHWQYKLRNQKIIKVVGGSGCLINSLNTLLVREPTWVVGNQIRSYSLSLRTKFMSHRYNIILGMRDSLGGVRSTAHALQESALPTNPTVWLLYSSV